MKSCLIISFALASPTLRDPKGIPGHEGTLELINAELDWTKENVRVVGMAGRVVSATTHPTGYGGGHVTITVEVAQKSLQALQEAFLARSKESRRAVLDELRRIAEGWSTSGGGDETTQEDGETLRILMELVDSLLLPFQDP
jgi:hypothetical protein